MPDGETQAQREQSAEVVAAYKRGRAEATSQATLREYGRRLDAINDSVGKTARELRGVNERVDSLREELRVRDERRQASTEALAAQTESRRVQVADEISMSDRRFSRRERMLGMVLATVMALLAVRGYLVA